MHKIKLENKLCVYLNHQELLDNLNKQHVKSTNNYYSLKSEIFNFKPKILTENADETIELPKRQRKRKAQTDNETSEHIKSLIEPFLKEIKCCYIKSNTKLFNDIPRVWEEPLEFPQFRGANSTDEFQMTQFGQNSFIIPPKSKFYNYNVELLPEIIDKLEKYDVIIMDMPWHNKYIKRLKKVKQSLAYKMLDNEHLKNIPIQELIHSRSLVCIWCTNAMQHRKAIEEDFLLKWNLKLVHILKWFKLNTTGDLISNIKSEGYKQPYELLYIACHKERSLKELEELRKTDFLASIPSIIHSHKPPLYEWLQEYLDDVENCRGLEIFARYLQPQFTSIGLEVLKLMDLRLYNKI